MHKGDISLSNATYSMRAHSMAPWWFVKLTSLLPISAMADPTRPFPTTVKACTLPALRIRNLNTVHWMTGHMNMHEERE